MMFTIEKGVPVPQLLVQRESKYPFAQMEVGDSFFVPDGTTAMIQNARQHWQKKLGRKFVAQAVEGGVRCWRTE